MGTEDPGMPVDDDWVDDHSERLDLDEVGSRRPHITIPIQNPTLPLADIPWETFERLCVEIVDRNSDGTSVHVYGVQGQRQFGIDIVEFGSASAHPAQRVNLVYQVKRYRRMTPAKLRGAVELYARKDRFLATSFTVITSASTADRTLVDELASLRQAYSKQFEVRLIGAEQLQRVLREMPSVVEAYFGPAMADALCGHHHGAKRSDRLAPEVLASAVEAHLNHAGAGLESLSSSLLRMDKLDEIDNLDVEWIVPQFVEERITDGEEELAGLVQLASRSNSSEAVFSFEELLTALTDPSHRLGGDPESGPETRYQIVAGPGHGKTTLAKRLHEVLVKKSRDSNDDWSSLSVVLSAASIESDLKSAVEHALVATTGNKHAAQHMAAQPSNLVVIVDALDQTQRTRELARALREWTGPLLLLGRLDTERFGRPIVQRQLRIADLARGDALRLFRNYLSAAGYPDHADIEARRLVSSASARNLLTSPLLVTLLAWWWSEDLKARQCR